MYVNLDGGGGSGGATRPLPKDGIVEELHGDLTVGPRPKVWTRSQNLFCNNVSPPQRGGAVPPLLREVGRNGKTTYPRCPIIRLHPTIWISILSVQTLR